MSKTDYELGMRVHAHLSALGVETPASFSPLDEDTRKLRMVGIADDFSRIMDKMGLDLSDDSLRDSPLRVAKMFTGEVFSGLDYANFPKCTVVQNRMNYDQLVIERNIEISSFCEHHFLGIEGVAHIGYIPKNDVVGLSKMNRIAQFFARRPQIQERLTSQIAETLKFVLGTEDVVVVVSAVHQCVRARGIEDSCSDTITSKLSGIFKECSESRAEFLRLIELPPSR